MSDTVTLRNNDEENESSEVSAGECDYEEDAFQVNKIHMLPPPASSLSSSTSISNYSVPASGSGYESGGDEEEDSDVGEILLGDSEDEDCRSDAAVPEMICFRCPTKREGTFKDEKKFWVHVKRHTFGEHFNCQTCKRPFTKLSYCISHEIRVHHTMLDYPSTDPVIKLAKATYLKNKLKKKMTAAADVVDLTASDPGEGASESMQLPNNETRNENQKTDTVETDDEDPKFYENQVFPSSATQEYRGPPVKYLIQSYEIHLNHCTRRDVSATTEIAEAAITQHLLNVQNNHTTCKLGEFTKKPDTHAKKKRKSAPAKRGRSPESESNTNTINPSSEEGKPAVKRRKVRFEYIDITSSEDDDDDQENSKPSLQPQERKEPDEEKEQKKEVVVPQRKIARRRTGTNRSPTGFPSVWNHTTRVCQKCAYVWKTQEDLCIHRNHAHPNISLTDLITVPRFTRHQRRASESPRKKRRHEDKPLKYGKYGQRPKASPPPPSLVRNPFPSPDATFTEKELFLHSMGLSEKIRLQLYQNNSTKASGNFKLKDCVVKLTRMTEKEMARYSCKPTSFTNPDDILPDDFLLDV